MYRYFTKTNILRYLGVINKLLQSCNDSIHYTIGLAPSQVIATNIYAVWRNVNSLKAKIRRGHVKFKINDLVRVTKEKVKFTNGYQQSYSTTIFLVAKIINRTTQPVYELVD
jgi:hypothetical protein